MTSGIGTKVSAYPSIFPVSVVPPKATRSSNFQLSQYEWLAFLWILEITKSRTTILLGNGS